MFRGTIDEFAELIHAYQEKNLDWFHNNCGYPGMGKTTFSAIFAAKVNALWNLPFNSDNMVVTYEDIKKANTNTERYGSVVIDEGAASLFAGDSAKREVKDLLKMITTMRHRNRLVIINVPDVRLIVSYVRMGRANSTSQIIGVRKVGEELVPRRGIALMYNEEATWKIRKMQDGTIKWPATTAELHFKKPETYPELKEWWKDYEEKSITQKKEFEDASPNERQQPAYATLNKSALILETVAKRPQDYITNDLRSGEKRVDMGKIQDEFHVCYQTAWAAKRKLYHILAPYLLTNNNYIKSKK